MPKAKRFASGFSLIEIMIVIGIIAILAAIAVPNYSDYIRRGKITEGLAQLSSLRLQMEQYFQDNRTYQTVPAAGTNCGLATPATKYFTYAGVCGNPPPSTYTITATGIAAQGTGGFIYSIDQSNNKLTVTATAWPNIAANTTCWVIRADGTC